MYSWFFSPQTMQQKVAEKLYTEESKGAQDRSFSIRLKIRQTYFSPVNPLAGDLQTTFAPGLNGFIPESQRENSRCRGSKGVFTRQDHGS